MKTWVHEDIFVYVDKIENQSDTLTGSNAFTFSNYAIDSIVDEGVITIDVKTGSYSSLDVTVGSDTLTIQKPLSAGDIMVLDLRERHYTLNGVPFLAESYIEMEDDDNHTLSLAFSGNGTSEVNYNWNEVTKNNMDLYFVTGLNIDESFEINQKVNVKGETKIHKNAKKDYKWSINGLCNDTELEKFDSGSGLFRLRFVDVDGQDLEMLANCVIASFQKSSSETGDYTYTLNGSFEKIFN